jgi:predicted deacetylase
MRLLISLHDVTPFHFARLLKAEALFQDMGLRKLTYLFIPNYHGRFASAENHEFVAWCRGPRPFEIEWQLHGDHHLEAAASANGQALSWADQWRRRLLTAGEGEFLALDAEAQRAKLASGRAAFRQCLGYDPSGFVAPAWLFNSKLPGLLKEMGFQCTEDRHRIFELREGRSVRSPVVTWATRTTLLKYGSIVMAPVLGQLRKTAEVLRIAIHPFDMDHDQTVASIRRLLNGVVQDRQQSFCGELDFGTAAAA